MLRSLEKCRESFATSRPVKSVNISVVAVEGLDRPGDVLVEAWSLGSMETNLSSLLLTSKGSDIPEQKIFILVDLNNLEDIIAYSSTLKPHNALMAGLRAVAELFIAT